MTKNRLKVTGDGSHTLYSQRVSENYHSSFGAIQESMHIFIDAGLNTVVNRNLKQVNILEVGTGTGLDILLAYLWSETNNIAVAYHGYEPYPISKEEVLLLNYPKQLLIDKDLFFSIHHKPNRIINLSNKFSLLVNKAEIENAKLPHNFYDVVFFDAFSPDAQPEMWSSDIFTDIYRSLKYGGVLTTYSCKGTVKRSLKEAGFIIEKLPGPLGKREFLRAWKE